MAGADVGGRRSSCGERRTRRPRRRLARGGLEYGDPGTRVDHRAPDRPSAVDRPGRGHRRHRRSPVRRGRDRSGRESGGVRRRRRRGAGRDPTRGDAGRLAAHPDPAARRTARRHGRAQAAVVRSADERDVDGDGAPDGDLGARARRRRRARGHPPRHRPTPLDSPHRGQDKGFRVLRARAGRAGRSVPRRADAHPTAPRGRGVPPMRRNA